MQLNFVLRFALGALLVVALIACSKAPPDTLLRSSVRSASVDEGEKPPRKTMSSDVLTALAMERVTGQTMHSRPGITAAQAN